MRAEIEGGRGRERERERERDLKNLVQEVSDRFPSDCSNAGSKRRSESHEENPS